jgi:spore germination cell wall hydrolase CwlJ-like protein
MLAGIVIMQFIIIACIVAEEPEVIIKEVEVIKEVPSVIEVESEPTYAYDITPEEREMLARLVYLEANTENFDCQKAIVSTVLNRWQNGGWGDNIEDVIYAKGQFSPANLISSTTPNNTNYEAVDEVIRYGSTLPSYVMFFRANYHFNWVGYTPYQSIDSTCFGYLNKDVK